MSAWLLAALLTAAPPPGAGDRPDPAPESAALSLPVRLADGATWTFTSDHSVMKTGSPPAESTTHRYEVVRQVTWRKRGAGGRLLVRPLSARMLEGAPPGAPAPDPGIPFELVVDAALRPEAFAEPASVAAVTERWITRDPEVQEALPRWKERTPGLVLSMAWALLAQDLALLSAPQGRTFVPGQPLVVPGEMDNPLGGPPIRLRSVLTLEGVDRQRGVANILVQSDLDPQSLRESIAAAARALFSADGEPGAAGAVEGVERALGSLQLDIQQACIAELDLATGLTLQAGCRKRGRVQVGARASEEVHVWVLRQTLPTPPGAGR